MAAVLALGAVAGAPAAARADSDVPLAAGYVTNGTVYAVALDESGRTYLGGGFTELGPRTENGLKLTTTSDRADLAFPHFGSDNAPVHLGTIRALVPDGSGGWFVGGDFDFVGDVTRNYLAHILSDGSLDASWNPNPDGIVRALAVSGGDLFVGGNFGNIGGQSRAFIAKLSTSGSGAADPTWNPNASSAVFALAASGDDVYAGGVFSTIGGQSRNSIAKLASSGAGAADPLWNPNSSSTVFTLAASGSDVYAGGFFSTIGGQTRNRVAKLSSSGTGAADLTWNPNPNGNFVYALAVSDGDVYAAGTFTTIGGQTRNRIARLSSSGGGTADLGWDPNANGTVQVLAVSGTDVYAGGDFSTMNGSATRRGLAKIPTNGDGTVDASWDPSPNGSVYALAVSGSHVMAGGTFTSANPTTRNALARLNADGTLDPGWHPNVSYDPLPDVTRVDALAVAGSNVYVGGIFSTIGGQSRNGIAKLSSSGSGATDPSWDPDASGGLNASVRALAVSGPDLYVGGDFTMIGGQVRNFIAKIPTSGDGTADPSWDPNADGQVRALVVSATDVFAGGDFTTANGSTIRNRIAKIPTGGDGTVDSNWDPDAGSTVYALAFSGADVYAGGSFATIGGQDRNHVAKLSASGSGAAEASWDPSASDTVRALAVSGSNVYVGGDFLTMNGGATTRNHLARILAIGDGTVDPTWDPSAGDEVDALAASGTRLAVGGRFATMGTTPPHANRGVALFAVNVIFSDGFESGSTDAWSSTEPPSPSP